MKAPSFEYQKPETLAAALAFLAERGDEVQPIAGGQSLMPMMNFRMAAPEVLMDLNGIDELSGISVKDGWIEIGAMTRYRTLEASAEVAEHAPLIPMVLPYVAHAAIRNRGTIGGSLALADPAAEMPTVVLVSNGEVVLQKADGQRALAAEDYLLGIYETAREEDELVVAIRLPVAEPGQRFGFHEIARRHGDYAMAGCIATAASDLSWARVAFFGVSDRAIRVTGAEEALSGSDGGEAALEAAVNALDDVDIQGDLHSGEATKRQLAKVALRRAWAEVMA